MNVLNVSGTDVAAFLGRADDTDLASLASQHVPVVAAFVAGYTRGRGVISTGAGMELADDLRAVVVSATARLCVNPAQLSRESSEGYEAVGAFNGWSLPEIAVLHCYRRRTA